MKWKKWICELFQAYLQAGQGTDGLPGAGVMPIYTFAEGVKAPDVALIIYADIRKRAHEYLLPFTVEFEFHSLHTGTSAITEETIEGYIQAARRRLQDSATLNTYLAALSLGARTGWQMIAAPTMNEEPSIIFDQPSGRRTHSEYLKVAVRIGEE